MRELISNFVISSRNPKEAGDAVVVIDDRGIIQGSNSAAEALFRCTESEMVGRDVALLVPEPCSSEGDSFSQRCRKTMADQIAGCPREVLGRRKDGSLFPMRLTMSEVTQGGEMFFLGIMRDLSELETQKYKLLNSQHMEEMGLVAGGIAHEFNNLLTVINGFAAILVRKGGDDPNVVRYASSILNAGLRGAKITRDLLAYSGNQILHPRVVDLNEFLESMEARVYGAVRGNITIEMDLSDRSNRIHVDPDLLEQMVVVLVRNASDAMRHGGCIRINTAVTEMNAEILEKATSEVAPGRYVVLEVADEGEGIEVHILPKIFSPFFTTKAIGEGVGLGLAMTSGFVGQSGGCVAVDSRPRQGATFRVYFPVFDGSLPESNDGMDGQAFKSAKCGIRVLMVEDQGSVREFMRGALEEAGYEVIDVGTAEEGLALAFSQPFDLLVSDVKLPGMSGLDLVARLREARQDLACLLVSGYPGEQTLRIAGLEERIGVLKKPFSTEEFLDRVRRLQTPAR